MLGGHEGDTNHHDDGEDEENKNVVNIQNMNSYSDILKKQMAHQQKAMHEAAQSQGQHPGKGHSRPAPQSQFGVQMHPQLQ